MEDSVGEDERREQGEIVAQAAVARHGEVEGGGGGDGGEATEEGGFLSAVASKIGATVSGANGSGGEVNATAASDGEEGERDGDAEPGEEGGFLSAVASKIGAAMSGANGRADDAGGNAVVEPDGDDKEKEDGNGGGGIFRKLLSSSPPASLPASGAMETEEVKGEERGQDVAGEQAGILRAMASKIGMAMSGTNGNGNHSCEDDTKMRNGDAKDDKEKGDEANGGGILSAMASNIGKAVSGANGGNHGASGDDAKASNGEAAHGRRGEEEVDEANGAGILSTVASKIGMAMAGTGTDGKQRRNSEDDAKTRNGDAVQGSKGEEKTSGEANGGGIVEQIISNLPSDDQAPDADEASLLIAIIED